MMPDTSKSFAEEKDLFGELLQSIPEFMEEEYRQDPEFRTAVLMDQIGSVARTISHCESINPPTRPLQEPEEVAYGDALWQLLCLAHIRDVDLEEAIENALDRMESQEGYKQVSHGENKALSTWTPDDSEEINGTIGKDVFVTKELNPDDIVDVEAYDAVVTEIGGMSSHAAIICRELDVPYAVGVNGISDSQEGERITIHFEDDTVTTRDKN